MNTTLLALNASYSHTSLAARYLRAASNEAGHKVNLVEMTVNERAEVVSRAVFDTFPAVLCCSVYIWNVRVMSDVCVRLKLLAPELHIIWGGPEVVGDEGDLRQAYPFVDTFCTGEGEIVLPDLLTRLSKGAFVEGMCDGHTAEMDLLPDPYAEHGVFDRNRLYYFETSRGCPHNCAYCISSREKGVRYLSEPVALRRLGSLSEEVSLIKFVDRTFNADRPRARRLWQELLRLPGDCRFHFEICAHLLTDDDFVVLSQPATHRLQFEVGLQSTSSLALSAVNRNIDPELVLDRVRRLIDLGTVDVHLDLIAGLPGEGYTDFLSSVERAMESRPHRLHLGFLKLLPGTEMRDGAERYQMRYLPYAPYEVLATGAMLAEEMLMLKDLESSIERYYNSRRFVNTISTLLNVMPATALFGGLAAKDPREPDRALFEIGSDSDLPEQLLRDLLLLDFLLREPHRAPPEWMMAQGDEATLLRGIVYGPVARLYGTLPHRAGVTPGLLLRDLRLCVLSDHSLRHIGLAQTSGILLIDHGQPAAARVFPVMQ